MNKATMEKGGDEGLRARPLPIVPSLIRFGCVEGVWLFSSLNVSHSTHSDNQTRNTGSQGIGERRHVSRDR